MMFSVSFNHEIGQPISTGIASFHLSDNNIREQSVLFWLRSAHTKPDNVYRCVEFLLVIAVPIGRI
ncbi:hypothetical protein HanRHA438_Chr03g0132781 [Helianthus annuus]|nr:hypothetical protein HanRHA438_Chr03g0132781 [Helianthus annuus]